MYLDSKPGDREAAEEGHSRSLAGVPEADESASSICEWAVRFARTVEAEVVFSLAALQVPMLLHVKSVGAARRNRRAARVVLASVLRRTLRRAAAPTVVNLGRRWCRLLAPRPRFLIDCSFACAATWLVLVRSTRNGAVVAKQARWHLRLRRGEPRFVEHSKHVPSCRKLASKSLCYESGN